MTYAIPILAFAALVLWRLYKRHVCLFDHPWCTERRPCQSCYQAWLSKVQVKQPTVTAPQRPEDRARLHTISRWEKRLRAANGPVVLKARMKP